MEPSRNMESTPNNGTTQRFALDDPTTADTTSLSNMDQQHDSLLRNALDDDDDDDDDDDNLKSATAAAVDAATNAECSDSILSMDDEHFDEGLDEEDPSTNIYMEQASVEPPVPRLIVPLTASLIESDQDYESNHFCAGEPIENDSTHDRHGILSSNVPVVHTPELEEQSQPPLTVLEILQTCHAAPTMDDLDAPAVDHHRVNDNENQENLLHSMFATFCTPPPSFQSVSRILALERDTSPDVGAWKQRTFPRTRHGQPPQAPIELPMEALISVTGKAPIVSLLCHSRCLLKLPSSFQLAFFRVLIRLMTNESDKEYDEECLRILPWWELDEDEYDNAYEESHPVDDFKNRTHERVQRMRNKREAIEEMRRRRSDATSQRRQSHKLRQRDQLYTMVRFRCGMAWKQGTSANTVLLDLLDRILQRSDSDHLMAPVARLLGLSCIAGISVKELRRMLVLAGRPLPNLQNEESGIIPPRDLRYPSFDRLLLVRALSAAAEGASQSTVLLGKASPQYFFAFGRGQGLTRTIQPLATWPFRNDFGMAVWFRAESFDIESGSQQQRRHKYPQLLSVLSHDGGGIEVSLMPLEERSSSTNGTSATVIAVTVFDSRSNHEKSPREVHRVKLKGCVLLPRVWYHVAVRHTRSRLKGVFALSSRQQISIMLDGKVLLTKSFPFPKVSISDGIESATSLIRKGLRRPNEPSSASSMTIRFGADFEGQTGSLYIFHENVSDATLKALYDVTAGTDGVIKKEIMGDASWDAGRADKAIKSSALAIEITKADADDIVLLSPEKGMKGHSRKGYDLGASSVTVADMGEGDGADSSDLPPELSKAALASKLFLVWDPKRTEGAMALDLHSGVHVNMDLEIVQPWHVEGAKHVIGSIGGVQAILPVFRAQLSGDTERNWCRIDGDSSKDGKGDNRMERACTFATIPSLMSLLASFVRDHGENAREMLRCGGIDIIEHFLMTNKALGEGGDDRTTAPHKTETFMGVISFYPGLSTLLAESLFDLRAACSHYTGLETTVFSRIVFNLPLWFGGASRTPGVALHAMFLPILSSIAKTAPRKVRDCVGVKQMMELLKEYTSVGDTPETPSSQAHLFVRNSWLEANVGATLTLNERRHTVDIILGMVTTLLASGTSSNHLSPLLNYISNNVDFEWEHNADDASTEKALRRGTRHERHLTTIKASTVLHCLLQIRPSVPGLLESFAQCCGGTYGSASWILCALVNSFDDTLRALGIGCLSAYLEVVAPSPDAFLTCGSALQGLDSMLGSGQDSSPIGTSNSSRMLHTSKLSTTISNVGKGLAAIGNGAVLSHSTVSSKVSVKVVYKLLWHLLKCHRARFGEKTHAAMVQLLVDDRGLHPFDIDNFVVPDESLRSGFMISIDRAASLLSDKSSLTGKTLRATPAINAILRLLRFLSEDMKDKWLHDLREIISTSRSNVVVLLACPQWQPSLFHLISEIMEGLTPKHRSQVTSSPDSMTLSSMTLTKNIVPESATYTGTDEMNWRDERESCDSAAVASPSVSTVVTSPVNVSSSTSVTELSTALEPNILSKSLMRFDLSLKIYSNLLGHCFRHGGDQAVLAVEQAASLQRVCVNGHEVFSLVLSHLLADLIDFGTLDAPSGPVKTDPNERNIFLKHSARIVTSSILSNGADGFDIAAAVKQWRCLRHLTCVIAAVVSMSGFGVVDLFDYRNQHASAMDGISGGLHGIRLPVGNIPGMSAADYVKVLGFTELHESSDTSRRERDLHQRLCVSLSSQVLSLLDAFIFPDSLDASLPASQLHGLSLVRSNEPRLGVSQGPLLASLLRLSLVLLCHLEPSSVKFLQCCSRLRCFLHWTLELIRESVSLAGYSAAFHDLTAPLDRLVLAVVLHCHRALARCSAVLIEIEASHFSLYFPSEDIQKKNFRRVLRVAFELREIVLAAYRGRNEVVRAALSLEAFEALQSALEQVNSPGSKETVIRTFLSSNWVKAFHDVDLNGNLAIPEQVASGQIYRNKPSSLHGIRAIEALALETNAIVNDFHRALDVPFESYCEDQRQWAETDAVRDLEYLGDSTVKRLSGKQRSELKETARLMSVRAVASLSRWRSVERKAMELWNSSNHWKLAKHTDRLNRRILLVRNRHFNDHTDASYELMLTRERERATKDREERARAKQQEELSAVVRRNRAFVPYRANNGIDLDGDDEGADAINQQEHIGERVDSFNDASSDERLLSMSGEIDRSEQIDSELDNKVSPGESEGGRRDERIVDYDEWARTFIWSETESVVARFDKVSLVALQTITEGKLLLTTHGLYFHQTGDVISVMTKELATKHSSIDENSWRWRLSRLTEVHGRRFMLRAQALELFFSDSHELFLNFGGGTRERDRFYAKLRNSCKVPLLFSLRSLNPRTVFKKSQLTQLWKKRKISNFQYLMHLNKMAGRTFNDITQYPVFPWVLADYTSDDLDLNDSRVFRDLSKPVGALNPNRLAQLIERYNDLHSFGFSENEKFLYGSHYSSPGVVLHFMLRQEPFTTMAIELQSGRFDCPDRLFFDLAGCWQSCMTSTSDVKELIPEFYTCPEMFLNTNKFPFGHTQDHRLIDDVGLPPWAKGSAYEFVRMHRLALESEYVSQNLHHWVDLIFGYKQRGAEAEAAHNVFHYLSYEGAVDLDKITDDVDRSATESHIQNFGQTPSQLLVKEPHPRRFSSQDSWKPLIYDITVPKHLRCHTPGKQFGGKKGGVARGAVASIQVMTESILVVYADLSIGAYKWSPTRGGHNHPFSIRMDKHRMLARHDLSTSLSAIKRGSTVPQSMDRSDINGVGNWSFAWTLGGLVKENLRRKAAIAPPRLTTAKDSISTAELTSLIVSCGYWDNSVKLHSSDGSKLLCSVNGGHRGPIRCLAIGDDGGLMVTGGQDGICCVWVIDHPDMSIALSDGYVQTALGGSHDRDRLLSCCHILWGHETPVMCLALSSDLDVTVSGSLDGIICVHTVRLGKFIRSFRPMGSVTGNAVRKLALDMHGTFIAHMQDESLYAYTINGAHISTTSAGELLNDMKICSNGEMLVTGGDKGQVVVRTVQDLQIRSTLDLSRHGPVRCISFTSDELNPLPQYLFIGSDDGTLTIVDKDPSSDEESIAFA